MAELSKFDWGQRAFDAGKHWRLSGDYYTSGVADARVVHYGFMKWLSEFPPGSPPRGITKAYLERSFREGYTAGKRVEKKANPGSTGIKFVLGITGTGKNRVSETQSVLFSRDQWTVSQAKSWLKDHGYRVPAVDEGGDYLRFRQSDPKKYKTLRTIEAGARSNPAGYRFRIWTAPGMASDVGIIAKRKPVFETDDYYSASEFAIKQKRAGKKVWIQDRQDLSSAHAYPRGNPAGDSEDHFATSLAHRLYPSVAAGVSSEGELQAEIHGALHGERVKNPKHFVAGQDDFPGYMLEVRGRKPQLFHGHTAASFQEALEKGISDSKKSKGAGEFYITDGMTRKFWRYAPSGRRLRNPDGTSAGLYEEFHGEPSSTTTEFREEEKYRDDLSELGTLVEIIVDTVTGLRATIQFNGNAPKLSASPDGKQLYFIGGDQAPDLDKLKLGGEKWLRDLMLIGDWDEVTYRTAKGFDNFKLSDYYHNLGEESGYRPVIVYDTLNKRMQAAGGKSHITSRGIED